MDKLSDLLTPASPTDKSMFLQQVPKETSASGLRTNTQEKSPRSVTQTMKKRTQKKCQTRYIVVCYLQIVVEDN